MYKTMASLLLVGFLAVFLAGCPNLSSTDFLTTETAVAETPAAETAAAETPVGKTPAGGAGGGAGLILDPFTITLRVGAQGTGPVP